MRVAIFDFDGTLYSKETFRLMMEHLKNHPAYSKKYKRFFSSILPIYLAYKVKLYPERKMRSRSMEIYLSQFTSFTKQKLEEYLSEIAEKMRDDFNPHVVDKLKEHAANNDYIMLVSGAYTPLLTAATKHLDIDVIIGTNIPYEQGILHEQVSIQHIQGSVKAEKIHQALHSKDIDWSNSFAYGDSLSDLPVLDLVGNPVAVQPEPRLKAVAEKRQWQII